MSASAARQNVHATVVAIGEAGIMIRGASGAGKSRLAQALIAEGEVKGLFARLVADDRAAILVVGGRVVARPLPANAGLLEERGTGLLKVEHEPAVVLRCLVDLDAPEPGGGPRLPEPGEEWDTLEGVSIARIRLGRDVQPRDGALRVMGRLTRL